MYANQHQVLNGFISLYDFMGNTSENSPDILRGHYDFS
jgi:hypothetical protein